MGVEKTESLAVIESINIWLKDLQLLIHEYRRLIHGSLNAKKNNQPVLELQTGSRAKIEKNITTIVDGISTILSVRRLCDEKKVVDPVNHESIASEEILESIVRMITLLTDLKREQYWINNLRPSEIFTMFQHGQK